MKLKTLWVAIYSLLLSMLWSLTGPSLSLAQTTVQTRFIPERATVFTMKPIERSKYFAKLLEKPSDAEANTQPLEQRYEQRQKQYLEKNVKNSDIQSLTGGVDSGGGTLVLRKNGSKKLLDLFNFPEYQRNSQPSLPVTFTEYGKACGMESFFLGDLPHQGYVTTLINQIEPQDNVLGDDMLQSVLQSTNFVFVDAQLSSQAFDPKSYVRENGELTALLPVALYIKGQGVLVSLPDFNAASFTDQLGILVHEILRRASIGVELGFSEKDLQQLTAKIIYQKIKPMHVEDDMDFQKAKLPAEMYAGILTPYVLRAEMNFICAWMENRGNKLGPACLSLAQTEAKDIYKVIPAIKAETTGLFPKTDPEFMWYKRLLDIGHGAYQARVDKLRLQETSILKLFSRMIPDTASACPQFLQALRQQNLILDKSEKH